MLAMYYREPREPRREDRDLVEVAGQLAALLIERAQAESALRGSEERYRLLFEGNPHPMWVYDLETLRFLAVNDMALDQYGYRREEFLAMTIADIRPPEDVPAVLAAASAAGRTGGPHSGVWRHRKKNGTLLDVEIVAERITLAGRPARLVLAHDVTERRRAEAATTALTGLGRELAGTLDLGEAMHRIVSTVVTFFGVHSSALYRVRPAGDALVCLAAAGSEASSASVGRTVPLGTEVVGPAVAEGRTVCSPDMLADTRLAVPAWLRERAEAEGFRSVVAVPLRSRGEIVGALVLRDVAGRMFTEAELQLLSAFADQAALALRNAEAHAAALARVRELDALVQVGRILMGTLDDRAVVRAVLEAAGRLVPESAAVVWEDRPGADEIRLFDEVGLRAPLEARRLRVRRGEGMAGLAAAARAPLTTVDIATDPRVAAKAWAAAEGLVSAVVAPLIHADTVYGTLAVYTRRPHVFSAAEVSLLASLASLGASAMANARLYAQVQAQLKELKDTQAQLLQAGKLTAVGQLVSGVAHELNNPLSVVIGYGQLLLARGVPPELRGRLELIVSHGERMAKIVQSLLLFSRQGEPERQRVDVRAVIERIVGLRTSQLALSGIQIETDFGVGVPPVDGDVHQLQQVVLNLLLNAEQAILGRGRVSGRCGDHIRVSTSRRSDGGASWVVIQVEDNGSGIPPEILSRIFEPFFTTKPIGEGTGLGLSVSYGIVQQHGGRLSVESAPGRAVFAVELPAATLGAEAPPTALPAPVAGGGRRVLVVDDEPDIVELITAVLGRHGWRIDIASGGRPALSRLQETCYDLVISDMRMADGSGEELYRAAVAQRPDIAGRFLFITGDTANPDAWQFLRTTEVPVLEKPFTPDGLFRALEGVIGAGSDRLPP
jgi:PAS domain S-box-containing protein